jgi:hypothetical protein
MLEQHGGVGQKGLNTDAMVRKFDDPSCSSGREEGGISALAISG